MYVNLAFAIPAAIAAGRLLVNMRPADAPADRRAGRPRRHGGAVRPGVRVRQRRDGRLGRAADRRDARLRGRCARSVRRDPAPGREPAAAAAHRRRPQPRRVLPRGRHRLDRDVRHVPVPDVLPAAEPGLLADRDRPGVPAHGGGDHGVRHHRVDATPPARRAPGRWSRPAWPLPPSASPTSRASRSTRATRARCYPACW